MPGYVAPGAARPPLHRPTVDYDKLLGDIAALRARVADVGDALFVSRIVLSLETDGDHAKVGHLTVELDDGVVYTAPPGFHSPDPATVYEHAVAPGHHAVTVEVDRKDVTGTTLFRDAQRSRLHRGGPEGPAPRGDAPRRRRLRHGRELPGRPSRQVRPPRPHEGRSLPREEVTRDMRPRLGLCAIRPWAALGCATWFVAPSALAQGASRAVRSRPRARVRRCVTASGPRGRRAPRAPTAAVPAGPVTHGEVLHAYHDAMARRRLGSQEQLTGDDVHAGGSPRSRTFSVPGGRTKPSREWRR